MQTCSKEEIKKRINKKERQDQKQITKTKQETQNCRTGGERNGRVGGENIEYF